ncbi:mpv17-like protein [Contarinia nasturtii]|uniref:mpv17-like protein n=1 Tax=Contarinia nasturtii TaxID=265458 RepID=UPI0012D3A31B|nr:mpv17-like protein [Contarinia nasturtii]XP_031634659.1 mpv17-like protein [Contarinia nasturtii]XP_031634660.1 mpv17-like protein [Contarinia nasturtii]XP_031634661.1 mpv17-like protein [Contarinia nasturtii]XP_031634662.1 mpv17-like protein [Contarinia nasturtii]XP_031634663.1 mpv17-like protein [Contarinia nasturtii]XP_031635637.1 mpv17-like protein [Contarinia nasturtii]XP_031635638.1 mpv17-like protein [Contarinia nasturtii]
MMRVREVFTRYPLIRGMVSYSLIWPTSAFIQQKIVGTQWDSIDWAKCVRFSIYGGFYVAPTLYTWIRISSRLFPQNTLRAAVSKGLLEQISYTPIAMTSFYFLMSLLEGKSIEGGVDEVKSKFWPTYKAAMCIWPAVSTFNFALVPEKNRVVFISVCSLMWTCFLAYMKQLSIETETNASNTTQFEQHNN